MRDRSDDRSCNRNYWLTGRTGALTLIILGIAVLTGWIFQVEVLKTILPGYISMKPNTALSFICAGVSLLFILNERQSTARRCAAVFLSAVVFLVGFLTLIEYSWSVNLRIDELLFRDWVQRPYPGRLAPITALNFVVVGASLLLISWSKKGIRWAQVLALLTGLSSLLAILGYFYGVPLLYGSFSYTSMALHTGIGFLVLAFSVLCCRPDVGWMAIVTNNGPGAWLSRKLIPAAVVIPIILGALFLKASNLLGDVRLMIASIVISQVILFAGLIWFLAFRMNRAGTLLAQAEVEQAQTKEALSRSEEMLRQSQKLEAVGQLAGGIAHDFNNLLSIILGYSELMLGGSSLEPAERRRVEKVKQAGETAASLVRQLLAFSRQQLIQPTVLGLNKVITGTNDMLRRLVREDVELIFSLRARANSIKADRGQIEQVLINLVVNASDAMPDGGTLKIETDEVIVDEGTAATFRVPPGAYVQLSVTDTGSGITPEVKARIFEPFFTTKPVGKGTGLGLATVYGIVQQSNGFIDLESAPGIGTSFKINFPVTTAEKLPEPGPQLVTKRADGATVLIAEDAPALRSLISEALEQSGYRVLLANDGAEALQICQQHSGPIHLLLTDVVMPNMNGRELVQRLKNIRFGIKIIFMSGYTNDVMVQHGVSDAGVEFMQKPFTGNELVRKIGEALSGTADLDVSSFGSRRA